jgi:hypothetical protein
MEWKWNLMNERMADCVSALGLLFILVCCTAGNLLQNDYLLFAWAHKNGVWDIFLGWPKARISGLRSI